MLHTKMYKSSKLTIIRRLMHECTNCIARVHSGLCNSCPHNTPWMAQELTGEMAERIALAFEQENTLTYNERNV